MVVHLIALAIPAVVVGTALWNYTFFSWHPICLSIAYGFLMSQGILLFSPHSSLIPSASRSKKINYHGYMLLIMLAMVYVGQTVIYTWKEHKGKEHFTTWHGRIGVLTVLYTTVQVLAGVLVKYASMFKLPKTLTLADLKVYHGASGCALGLLGCASLALGMASNWFTTNTHEYVRGGCLVAVALMAMAIVNHGYALVQSRVTKIKK